VFRVLQEVFGKHRIAAGLRIPRLHQIPLVDVRRRTADTALGAVAVEPRGGPPRPRERRVFKPSLINAVDAEPMGSSLPSLPGAETRGYSRPDLQMTSVGT
jgi:hypothetical protein